VRRLGGKRVLITGAAQGIGRALAARFAAAGARLVLTDLRALEVEGVAAALRDSGAETAAYPLDVTDPASIERARAAVHDELGPIDVLVNNAGVVFGGPFLDVPLARHEATYRVNLLGLAAVTHCFLPDLISRPEGHLVNLASASGLIGLPFGSTYASSKWGVIGLSDSVRLELKLLGHKHVAVTVICPSYVGTGLFEGAIPPRMTRLLSADRVAALTIAAILRNRPYVLTPGLVKLTPVLRGVLPARWFDAVSGLFGATSSMRHWRGRRN